MLGTADEIRQAGSSLQWGDVATWALAVIAFAALVAAVLAYRKQADTARELSRQVGIQSKQLDDQQEANRKQAQVIDVQLREMAQRAAAFERQQADHINLKWAEHVDGYMAIVMNESRRPIRDVACQIEAAPGQGLQPPIRVGPFVPSKTEPGKHHLFDTEGSRVSLIRVGESYGFVFGIYDYSEARITALFTDDAGLHWQIDHDLHLEKLDNRDDW